MSALDKEIGAGDSASIKEAEIAYKALNDKKAENIKVLDIRNLTVIADVFVIASGSNPNQLKAMADEVEQKLKQAGITPSSIEGYQSARWILLDFGQVVVHLFNREEREFYNLDRIWADAQEIIVQ